MTKWGVIAAILGLGGIVLITMFIVAAIGATIVPADKYDPIWWVMLIPAAFGGVCLYTASEIIDKGGPRADG